MIILVVALALALAAVLLWHFWPVDDGPAGWLEGHTYSEVVVQGTDGHTYQGLLVGVFPDGLVLTSAAMVDQNVPMAGDVFLPRAMIGPVQYVSVAP